MIERIRQRLLLCTLGALTLLVSHGTSAACDANALMQACDFDSPYSATLQYPVTTPAIGDIGFRITSKRIKKNGSFQDNKYRVTAYPDIGSGFTLVSEYGDELALALTYNNWDGNSELLSAGIGSGQMSGTVSYQPASLTLARADTTTTPRPGSYAGSIRLVWEPAFACKSCTPFATTIDLTVVIPATIAISGLDDVTIDYPANSHMQTFCVSTSAGMGFNIRADSETGAGRFALLGPGTGDIIDYRVAAGAASGITEDLVEGLSSATHWPGDPLDNCASGGENMQLLISVDTSALERAVETSYADKLTLTVEVQ
ncbi:hypothetical protein [Microbulbifer sediminum]|uniref:hypothetical protein n=1 Tax=Microbulbifer sediminum TaxID=2904250 RepID=UPI001F2BCF4B|nr:hypothetical protein [Microbulbifer sediminum]